MHKMQASDWLAKRARLSPQRIALVDAQTKEKRTYQEWNVKANQTAHFFGQFSVTQGDRVAILAMNSLSYLDVFFACGKLGAVLQNLNWRLTTMELKQLIGDAQPKILFYGASFREQVKELRAENPALVFIALEEKEQENDLSLRERGSFSQKNPTLSISMEDPWVICYTGGTTGLPKGAILTHQSITFNAVNTITSWQLQAEDTAILNAPLFHTGALNVFTTPLVMAGGTSIVCTDFSLEQMYELIPQANLFFGVPTMFLSLQEHSDWEKLDMEHLKLIISGGAPCPLPIFEKFWAKNVSFKTGYGLTEAGPNNFWLPDEDVQRKPGSVGFPLWQIETKLVDEKGQEILEAEKAGELLLRGPHCSPGYWNNPAASKEAMDSEGWLHTGDLAQRDEEGYYYIVGRLKDLIISGGENIYPAEIESVLYGHEEVIEAAVIGVADKKWGEVGRAFIVAKNKNFTPEILKDYCQERLARYKIPKEFVLISELPKTGAGKIDKKKLKTMLVL